MLGCGLLTGVDGFGLVAAVLVVFGLVGVGLAGLGLLVRGAVGAGDPGMGVPGTGVVGAGVVGTGVVGTGVALGLVRSSQVKRFPEYPPSSPRNLSQRSRQWARSGVSNFSAVPGKTM